LCYQRWESQFPRITKLMPAFRVRWNYPALNAICDKINCCHRVTGEFLYIPGFEFLRFPTLIWKNTEYFPKRKIHILLCAHTKALWNSINNFIVCIHIYYVWWNFISFSILWFALSLGFGYVHAPGHQKYRTSFSVANETKP
jgi:hypothetical protein